MSTKDAPKFLASKWLHFDFLVGTAEFAKLFEKIEPLYLFSTMGVQPKGQNSISKDDLISAWQRYLDCLQNEKAVNDQEFRFFFTAVISKDLNALRALDLPNEREVIIPYEPIVQMQLHRFSYSVTDKKFHSQAFGQDSISWGVRLSYPQLFQYPHTRQVENAIADRFTNASLVSIIRSWLREVSIPTPFIVDGVKINQPMRIGRSVFSWIDKHPDLKAKKIQVLK